MDPATMALLGIGVQGAGSVLGEFLSGKSRSQQEQILRDVYERFGSLKNPDLQQVHPGELPESEAGKIGTDPELRQAQLNAMSKLKGIEDNGGLDLADMAAQNKALSGVYRGEAAGRNSIQQGMERRGMAGSGAALAASLANQQNSANQAGDIGMQTAGNAQRRYYDAIMGRSKMAGDLRNQDYSEAERSAQARDLRNRYNNDAQTRAMYHNADLPQQDFNNSMTKLSGQAAAGGQLAGNYGAEAGRQSNLWSGLGVAGREALRPQSSLGSGYGQPPDPRVYASQYPDFSNEDEWNQWKPPGT